MATFRSQFRNLRVDFPPDKFGMITRENGERAPHPSVEFMEGIFTTTDNKLIGRLRSHSGFSSTSSEPPLYHEDSIEIINHMRKMAGPGMTVPDGNITVKDKELISEAKKFCEQLSKPEMPRARVVVEQLIERFQVTGVEDFSNAKTPEKGKSILLAIVDIINQAELPLEETDASKGNS